MREKTLEDISLDICPGEKIALVGESGSGKTTFAKLMLRFYEWEHGDIFIGDHRLDELPLELIRRKTAYVSQDAFFFSGSIMENLTLSDSSITREEAENRLRSQMDTAEKARRANVVIPTDGTIEETAALIPPLYAAELAKEGSHGKHTASQTK